MSNKLAVRQFVDQSFQPWRKGIRRLLLRLAALSLALASALQAQAHRHADTLVAVFVDRTVDHISSADVRDALSRVAPDSRGVTFRSSRDGRSQYVLNRRSTPSEAEVHARWDDLFIVESGAGTIRYGGHIVHPVRLNREETRGDSLNGARSVDVAPGDLVRVPAGVPHDVRPLGSAPLVYLVVKTVAPAGR